MYIYIYSAIFNYLGVYFIVRSGTGRGREYAILDYGAAQLFRGHLVSLNENHTC